MRLILTALLLICISCMGPVNGPTDESSGGEGLGYTSNTQAPTFNSSTGLKSRGTITNYKFLFYESNSVVLDLVYIRVSGIVEFDNTKEMTQENFEHIIDMQMVGPKAISIDSPYEKTFTINNAFNIKLQQVEILGRYSNGKYLTPKHFKIQANGIDYYEANHLTPHRFAWYPSTPSKFVTQNAFCQSPKVQNENAECVRVKKSCNDIQSEFNSTSFPCAVQMDGTDIDCDAIGTKANCSQLHPDNLCEKYHEYLENSEQLIQLLYKGEILNSKVCIRRIIQ